MLVQWNKNWQGGCKHTTKGYPFEWPAETNRRQTMLETEVGTTKAGQTECYNGDNQTGVVDGGSDKLSEGRHYSWVLL